VRSSAHHLHVVEDALRRGAGQHFAADEVHQRGLRLADVLDYFLVDPRPDLLLHQRVVDLRTDETGHSLHSTLITLANAPAVGGGTCAVSSLYWNSCSFCVGILSMRLLMCLRFSSALLLSFSPSAFLLLSFSFLSLPVVRPNTKF
jgi:hypothetical protein